MGVKPQRANYRRSDRPSCFISSFRGPGWVKMELVERGDSNPPSALSEHKIISSN